MRRRDRPTARRSPARPRGRRDGAGGRGRARGQSPIVGVALLLAIVVLGSVVIALVGGPALGESRRSVDLVRAEHAMGAFDSRASAVALNQDGSEARDVTFGRVQEQGGLQTTRESWIRVEVIDGSTGVRETVVDESLGTVVYTNGDTTVAYEGGGVWRSDGESSVMLSPPEFHFREDEWENGTLTLPIINVTGDGTLGDRLHVVRNGPTESRFPDENRTNKVRNAKVRITVHSEYYLAWGRYFEETSNGIVEIDGANETASVTYLSLPRWIGLNNGIIATSGVGEIKIGGNSVYIDSYNSSGGRSYAETRGENGSLTAAGDVVNRGTMSLLGDVRSGAFVDMGGTATIEGSVYYTDGYDCCGSGSVRDGFTRIEGVADIEPIDGLVRHAVDAARDDNDNARTAGLISGNRLTGSGTLSAGTYYLTDLTIGPGDTVNIDTSGGDVTIAVENTVSIDGKGNSVAGINVLGDGTVTLFVLGGDPVDFEIGDNGRVDVANQERAGQFRVYGTRDFDAVITSNRGNTLYFEGVIYAPAGRAGSGSVEIGQAEFYGAIITGDMTIKQGAEIHYDQGLATERFPRSPTVSRLEFLHVAVHPIRVTG